MNLELLALTLLLLAPGLACLPRGLAILLGFLPSLCGLWLGLPASSWFALLAFSSMGCCLGMLGQALARPALAWTLWWVVSLIPLWIAPFLIGSPFWGKAWFLWPGAYLHGTHWDPARLAPLYSQWDSIPVMGSPSWTPVALLWTLSAGVFWVARRPSRAVNKST